MRELGLPLTSAGPVLEAPEFWDGLEVERRGFGLAGACAVVLPDWVEDQPRRLPEAIAAGVPVIATAVCGLGGLNGVTTIPAGERLLSPSGRSRSIGRSDLENRYLTARGPGW